MIDTNSILQVDGTVIAGVLILLTIRYTRKEKLTREAGFVPVPFAISAIFGLFDAMYMDVTDQTTFTGINIISLLSVAFTMLGFVYLILFLRKIYNTKSDESSIE